jgi:hypothetical protein
MFRISIIRQTYKVSQKHRPNGQVIYEHLAPEGYQHALANSGLKIGHRLGGPEIKRQLHYEVPSSSSEGVPYLRTFLLFIINKVEVRRAA